MKHIKLIFSISMSLVILFSCKEDKPEPNNQSFSKSAFLTSIYDSIIYPMHQEFVFQSQDLENYAQQYNVQINSGNLEKVQEKLDTLFKLENCSYLLNIAPIKNTYIHFKIGTTPCDSTFIYNKIISQPTLSQDEIDFHSGSRKGLGAIDYLTYGNNKLIQAQNNIHFANHLTSYSKNVNTNISLLLQEWIANEANYKTATESSVDGSYNRLINGITNSLEVMRLIKLNAPLNSSPGNPSAEFSETPYSRKNISIIRAELQLILKIFSGNKGNFIGIKDNLLDLETNQLVNNINSKLNLAIEQCKNIENTDFEVLLTTQANEIETLMSTLADLILYFKSDVSSLLGVIITPGDVDGD